jgi:hypothetical protein
LAGNSRESRPHIWTQQQIYQQKFNHPSLQQQQQQQQQPSQYQGHQPPSLMAANNINSINIHPSLVSALPKAPLCGVQPLKSKFLQKRIIGGDQASFGEFPWQAHIRIAGFQCGGVLLNNQYIATAAHCVHRYSIDQANQSRHDDTDEKCVKYIFDDHRWLIVGWLFRAKLSQIIIYLGEYDTKDLDKTEILPKETLGVLERKIHPQFKYMLTQPDR